MGVIIASCCEK